MPISHQHTPYTYNEFVAPMDADYLIKAVDLKQNLYDQGTAAVEAKMQELAGFDIAKEEDRAYANQELKKIYQAMQSGASKDFSNPQVVKSFLDVAKPLERDAIFKNAQNSTIELRKRQKTIADVITNHPDKYSQANESEYMDDLDEWMANPNAGAVLSRKEYTPWKDVSKEMTDITSKMKEEVLSDAKKSGKYLIETDVKRLTADRVKAVIETLDPSYKRQIEIDANYQAKNTDVQTKWEAVTADTKEVYDYNMRMSNIPGIENHPDNTEKLTGADYRRRAELAAKHLNEIQGDTKLLDASYANHYINNWEDNMNSIYSYQQESQKIKADPFSLVNANLAASLKVSAQNHVLDWENKQKQLQLEAENKKQLMLLSGEAMIDPATGNLVHNPNYKPTKLTQAEQEAEDAKNYIFSREEGTNKDTPVTTLDNDEERIQNGTLTDPIQKSLIDIDGIFKNDLEAAARFVVGDREWGNDYSRDYDIRFEPLIEGDKKTTKVTLVDADSFFKDNISFTIGELLEYSARYNKGERANDAVKTNSK